MADSSDNSNVSSPKPCRACSNFKMWAKNRRKKELSSLKESTDQTSIPEASRELGANCPLTKDELGRKTWSFLHTMAAYYPEQPTDQQQNDATQFFQLFSRFYPCQECAEDLQRQIERFPPKTESQEALTQWLCRVHNRINLKLGKPIFDCSTVNERWKDGWRDGSCD